MALPMLRSQLVTRYQSRAIFTTCRWMAKDKSKPGDGVPVPEVAEMETKPHPETDLAKEHPVTREKGRIADTLPFRMELTAGKKYSWCACGHSHAQPFCDGNHKRKQTELNKPYLRPWRFTVEETKEYWLCRCKQTDNPPFCDGSHKFPNVANLTKILPTT